MINIKELTEYTSTNKKMGYRTKSVAISVPKIGK